MKNLVCLLICSLFFLSAKATVLDSLGVEKKNGKYFVKHQIEAKETVYALSRKYGITVAEIKEANPDVNFSALGIGQIVYVPTKNVQEKKTAETKPAEAKAEVKTASSSSAKKHKVQPKETLFALAQKYGVSVDELKKANPELDKGLQVGMELTIPQKGETASATAKAAEPRKEEKPAVKEEPAKVQPKEEVAVKKEEPKKEVAAAPKKETTPAKAETTPVKKASLSSEIPTSNSRIEKVKENGMAEAAPARTDGPDYFALHKTAPVGTIIHVTNEENNQSAFVRVVGTSSSSAIIQLSPKTLTRLNAKDQKAKVSLSYYKP